MVEAGFSPQGKISVVRSRSGLQPAVNGLKPARL
jgi:hypothetical protein